MLSRKELLFRASCLWSIKRKSNVEQCYRKIKKITKGLQ